MLNVRSIVISILVAYLCHIVINFLFISINSNKQIANHISIEEQSGNNIKNEIGDEKEVKIEAEEEVEDTGDNLNLSYKIQGREAIQVTSSAKTQNLPHSPSNNETQYGKYLGCYADKINKRILQDLIEKYHKTNTRRKCIDKCLSEGIPFAGVQYAEECFCGNERPPLSSKLPEDACDMTCTGAPDEICGGRFTINVFETGAAIPPDPPNIGNFKPPCKIQGLEAVSAIRRAKTESCKQKIANVTCLIQKGDFYPKYLPHTCPNNGTQYGRYLGCYVDKFNARILPWKQYFPKTNTRQICIDKCLIEGFPYAGVQFGTECFCGNERPPSTSKWPENACDMICPGAPDEICGGSLTMNVFETGIAKFVPRTPTIPSNTTSTKPARIVFLLTINGRALRQVNRLINALYRPHHYIYIHVDARHDYLHRKLSVLEKRFPNIKMVTPRFTTIWGGISFLKSLLSSMKNLFAFDWEWDFLVNISECGFPINSIENLEKFLSVNKGLNFVEYHNRENSALYVSFVECEERMWLIGKRKVPKNMITYAGSDWFTLSREFISYVLGPKDEFLTGFTRLYDYSIYAAEAYFHHILRNTRFCNTHVIKNLHHVNWDWHQGCKCAYRHIVDWCGCSPMDIKPKDWERIQNAVKDHYFFARKFEPVINQEIINKVEKFIGADDYDLLNNLDGYWENIFDIEDNISTKDDLFISHAKSITRINANKMSNHECSFEPGQVIQIHTYKKADIYEGNLVLHEVSLEGKNIILEALYKPKKLELNLNREYVERIKIFEVSSQYDQKEQVFRNFANILGPFTEPVLVYEILPDRDETENFTIHWLDPAGRVAGINEIYVNTKNYTNFINSQLPTPLLPGIWKVGLFEDSKLILQTKFLITPFECFSRKVLSSKKAGEINGGSQNSYPQFSQFPQLPNAFFPKEETEIVMQEIAVSNAKKTNDDVRKWIDELTIQFYDVKKSCISLTKKPLRCGENVIDVCELTEWSSLSPDPKGTVGNLNKNTGKLERV